MNLIRFILIGSVLAIAACGDSGKPAGPDPGSGSSTDTSTAAPKKVSFTQEIKPLLESRCLICHNTGTLLGHLNLETRSLAFQPGPEGPFIVPGKPEQSKLYTFTLIHGEEPKAMPPTKHKLDDAEKALLRNWIAQGAEWPEGPEGNLRTITEPSP